MAQTIEGIYDGVVLRPDAPLQLKADTRVRITVEALADETEPTPSFLDTLFNSNLEGFPSDFSANIDHYLYGLDKAEQGAADEKAQDE